MTVTMHHGVRTLERIQSNAYIQPIDTAAVVIVVTAPDATAAIPKMTPVKLLGFDDDTLEACGATGTMRRTLDIIGKQGYAPLMAVIRVAEDADADAQAAHVVAGIAKMLEVYPTHDFEPTVIGAPELDGHKDVADALGAMAKKLGAEVYVGLPSDIENEDDAIAEKTQDHYQYDDMMLMWPDLVSGGQRVSAAAAAIGARVRVDVEHPKSYAKTLSNMPINGVEGTVYPVSWDIEGSEGTGATKLNNKHITTVVKNRGQWRWWGNFNATGKFESSQRIRNIIKKIIANSRLGIVDEPMSVVEIENEVLDIKDTLVSMRTQGVIVNGDVWLNPNWNKPENIKAGGITIHYKYTPPPAMQGIKLVSVETGEYLLEVLPDWVQSDAGIAAPSTIEEES